jgi:biofilm PGA synthesis N-glycosyltransferase PgaC
VNELTHLPPGTTVITGDAPGGKACSLNAGVRSATGNVVVLADTAQRFDRRTIPELVAALEDPRFAAVSGALHLGGQQRWSPIAAYWRLEKWLRFHEAVVHSSIGVTGAVYAIRRDCWPSVPPDTLLDDVYVPMALVLGGWRVGFTPKAQAWDTREFTAAAESSRKTRTLTGLFQLHDVLPGLLSLRNPLLGRYIVHKLAATALLVAVTPPLRRKLISSFTWLFETQRAVLRALRNGIGKDWRVWQKNP